jgi:hypothetical protein
MGGRLAGRIKLTLRWMVIVAGLVPSAIYFVK